MGQEADEPGEEPEGLLARLARVPDPRNRHGRRYPVQVLLGIAVAAVLSGARSYTEVGEFAAELSQEQLAALGCVKRPWEAVYQAPKETALRRLLQRLDVEALDGLVGAWLAEQLPEEDASAVAVDGKSLRGAIGADRQRPHLLAALVHGHGAVVAQRRVAAKTSEIGAFAPLLEEVELTGRVVTADSLHSGARPLPGRRSQGGEFAVGMVVSPARRHHRGFLPPTPIHQPQRNPQDRPSRGPGGCTRRASRLWTGLQDDGAGGPRAMEAHAGSLPDVCQKLRCTQPRVAPRPDPRRRPSPARLYGQWRYCAAM